MKTILAIDANKWACDTYRANFPGTQVECAPIAEWVPRLPCADILLGGPPCQPFSTAGEGKGESDTRDCIPDYIASVRRVRPRHFIMENVAGLLQARHYPYFFAACKQLADAGYAVQWRLMDAVNFGVPQFRNRVWVWGIRRDLAEAGMRHSWPVPTHAWPPPQDIPLWGEALLPGVTVGQALGLDVSVKRHTGHGGWDWRPVEITEEPSVTITGTSSDTQPRIIDRAIGSGCCLRIIGQPGSEPHRLDMPCNTVLATEDRGARHQIFDPSRTPSRASDTLWRAIGRRRLSTLECARLQSVPDDFAWPDPMPKTHAYRIVGNGQASLMVRRIRECVEAVDPEAGTVIDLFCGGGIGAVGWHGRAWEFDAVMAETGAI